MKNHQFYLILCVCLVFVTLSKCQLSSRKSDSTNEFVDTVNFKDTDGLKQGLWIDTARYVIRHSEYANDTLHGSSKRFNLKTNRLLAEGKYDKGERIGKWRYYDRKKGNLLYEESQIKTNVDIMVKNNSSPYVPPKMSYIKSYDREEGYLVWEGNILYNDSFEEDTHVKHGKWVYYDKAGNIIRTESYEVELVVD